MATKKISELDAITSIDSNDLFVVVDTSEGETNKITKENALSGLQPTISSTNKISSDLVDDTNATNLFVSSSDIATWNSKLSSESDPVFTTSPAYGISNSDITNWNGKQDGLTAGSNITISNGTISATDTTYTSESASQGGTTVSLCTTGEKYTWNNKSDFSGSYNDLSNKPTIPDELADLTDDSTHRLVTDTEKTTWSGKQDALVSGTNIKTINNQSLLGSGNIVIQGGGGSSYTAGDYINIDSNNVISGNVNIIKSTASENDVGTAATKRLNFSSLKPGKYIYYNYSATSDFKLYYQYNDNGNTVTSTLNTISPYMEGYQYEWTVIELTIYKDLSDVSIYSSGIRFGEMTIRKSTSSQYVMNYSLYRRPSGNKFGIGIQNWYVDIGSVLSKENTYAFTPTSNYHPATKKYVDDSVSGEVIWTNSNPTGEFSAQTLQFADSYNYYDIISWVDGVTYETTRVYLNKRTIMQIMEGGFIRTRYATATSNSIEFSKGTFYQSYSSGADNNYQVIPYQIIGYK